MPEVIGAREGPDGYVAVWRYKCEDSARIRPYLASSTVTMAFIPSMEFGNTSQWYQMLPNGGSSQQYIDFDRGSTERAKCLGDLIGRDRNNRWGE